MYPFLTLWAQEKEVGKLLQEEYPNISPLYKPVIGLGSGVFNFYGDVKNNYINPVLGDYGYKFNVSSFLDQKRYYTLNLYFLYGKISGNERSFTDLARNLNFKTDLVNFGASLEYNFDHVFRKNKYIKPFLSAGIENIQFTPKGDLLDQNGNAYHYWSDGTIRNIPEINDDIALSTILHRDYKYETDLRKREETLHGLGSYSQNTFAIPLDAGLNFKISDRIFLKMGTSFHLTFTDFLDNVSSKGTSVKGKKGNDFFTYNYFTLHFDLFSEPETVILEKMFAEFEFDEVMLDDEDGDYILDSVDDCPGTPFGIAVDSTGCPLDGDNDGIPDYLDKENFSAPGAWVDENGVTITEEMFLERMSKLEEAMKREDVKAYFSTFQDGFISRKAEEIPEKFKEIDRDRDGYISFEELLEAIDGYFDQQIKLSVEDIYELNNFFFRQ